MAETMKELEKEQIQEISETLPDHLNVMKQEIDTTVQKKYLDTSEALRYDTPTSEDIVAEGESLFLKDTSMKKDSKEFEILRSG